MLESAIYIISASMLYPAMILLVGGFVVVVASIGGFAAEWAERSRIRKSGVLLKFAPRDDAYVSVVMGSYAEHLRALTSAPDAEWDDAENLWRTIRNEMTGRLDYLRVLARLGPAMGLVGTLIPMSTGLASLGQGDTSRLASDLVVAFSTTVVGLCYGVAAYVLYTIRARWLEENLERIRVTIESRAAAFSDTSAKDGGGA
jgi:biopolymer transport protein ExbB/TolQ